LLHAAQLALLIEITFPLQLAAQLTNFSLLAQQDQRAQGFLHHFALGFDTGQFLGTFDQVFIYRASHN
jgi:hypothetical protein